MRPYRAAAGNVRRCAIDAVPRPRRLIQRLVFVGFDPVAGVA